MEKLPPVPTAPTAPPAPAAPRTVISPIQRMGPAQAAAAAGVKTAFDEAPAAAAAARQRAAGLRSAAATTLRQLATLAKSTETTLADAKGDAALTDALAAEGLSSKHLAELLKLSKPLLDAFTTPPPAAPAS